MKFFKVFALAFMLMPTHAFASGKLSSADVKYLIKTCFETLYDAGFQPFQVDRKKFARMGFSTLRDDNGVFEAQRILGEGIRSMHKLRDGPTVKIRRKAKKPDRLLHKSCTISSGELMPLSSFTKLSSAKVQDMLEAEAKRRGFKPYRNAKGRVVWIKADVAVFLSVSFPVPRGQAVDRNRPPSNAYVDGVHPKNLRGIKR